MRLRLTALALADACGMVLAAGQARADVIYDFTTTSFSASNGKVGLPLSMRFDLEDAAIASGSFHLVGVGFDDGTALTGPHIYSTDTGTFIEVDGLGPQRGAERGGAGQSHAAQHT